MDKIDKKYCLPPYLVLRLDEIINWINARDGLIYDQQEHTTSGEHRRIVDPPSIEQELESGLEKGRGVYYVKFDKRGYMYPYLSRIPCTRIFLPAAKYEEYKVIFAKECISDVDLELPIEFHDIPVFSTNDKVITYCTD